MQMHMLGFLRYKSPTFTCTKLVHKHATPPLLLRVASRWTVQWCMCAPSTMTCGLVGGAVALMNCGASARAAISAGRMAMWRIKHTAAAKPAHQQGAAAFLGAGLSSTMSVFCSRTHIDMHAGFSMACALQTASA